MFKKLRISTSAFIILSLSSFLIAFTLFSVFSQANMYESYLIQSRSTEIMDSVQELKLAISDSLRNFDDYLSTENAYKLSDYHVAISHGSDMIKDISSLIGMDNRAAFTLSSIKESFGSYIRECNRTYELFGLGKQDYYGKKERAGKIAEYMNIYLDELISIIIENNIGELAATSHSRFLLLFANLIVLFIFIIFLIAIILIFSRNLSRPLKNLSQTAIRISEGNLDARAVTGSHDRQVNLLTETFNEMADDIQKMMQDLTKRIDAEKKLLEEQKKNMEVEAQLDRATFLALQTQTNPHFLFNTLNTIDRTIQLGKTADARKMLHSISSLMRYNLSDGNTPAVMREEVEITEEYLSIQKIRFSDRLSYSIDIDDKLLDTVFMPRFTLQPLVENAIIHGLTGKEEGGNVSIRAVEEGNDIVLSISDDGVGMREEAIKEALNKSWRASRHIGISNTMHRIELFTERQDAFSITSEIGKGTTVMIRLRRS